MAQHHTIRSRLAFGEASEAFWALKPTEAAIVFVHGFRGHAIATWLDFPRYLLFRKECEGRDLIFYGYDGGISDADTSAAQFHDFLQRLLKDPYQFFQPALQAYGSRPRDFSYKKVLIVAHSLGAIITRMALLSDRHLRAKCGIRFAFYAPAHHGARAAELARLALGPILGKFEGPALAVARMRYQAIEDLEPGSKTLKRLVEEHGKACAEGDAETLRAVKVLWAQPDSVVYNRQFPGDPVAEVISGTNHVTVCKPTVNRIKPAVHLLSLL